MNNKLSAAKTAIVLDQPFFGSLLCHLKFNEDSSIKTACTDGTQIRYNPAYIDSLSHAEIVGLLAHEVMHCAAGHPFRRDGREGKKFNYACDYAINPILTEAGISLPKGAIFPKDTTWVGKSAEWIYDRMPDLPNDAGDMAGEVEDAPSGNGDSQDGQGKSNDDAPMSEGEWKEITRQAATQAQMRGNLPDGIKRFAKEAARSRVDWKAALRKFVEQNAKADYTWSKPSPRYISQDIYLPAMQSEDMPPIAIAVDTSGSMDDIALAKAKAEVLAVVDEVNPSHIDVFYADSRVANHDTFERGESVEFKPAGGGGTSFIPVFEAVDKMSDAPVCIIYITDLEGSFPEASDIPTLWITDTDHIAPFGDTIKID